MEQSRPILEQSIKHIDERLTTSGRHRMGFSRAPILRSRWNRVGLEHNERRTFVMSIAEEDLEYHQVSIAFPPGYRIGPFDASEQRFQF